MKRRPIDMTTSIPLPNPNDTDLPTITRKLTDAILLYKKRDEDKEARIQELEAKVRPSGKRSMEKYWGGDWRIIVDDDDALVAQHSNDNFETIDIEVSLAPQGAAGADTQVQYNAGGVMAAEAAFTYNYGTNTLTTDHIQATIDFTPNAADGASLGRTDLEFSDLYLADGAVIYLGNDQDVTITHVHNVGISLNGDLRIDSDADGLILGDGQDAGIYYDGNDMVFDSQLVGAGDFYFRNGFVGIGTATPSNILTVYTGAADCNIKMQTLNTGTGAADGFNFGVSNATLEVYLTQRENANMQFWVNNAFHTVLTPAGYMGIGYNNPSSHLTVYSGNADVSVKLQTLNTGTLNTDGFNFGISNATLDVYINQRENADILFYVNNTFHTVFEAGGNVGIGITGPDGTLHVHTASAGAVVVHANADDLTIENSTNGGISILTPDASAGYLVFGCPSNNFWSFLKADYSNNQLGINNDRVGGEILFRTANNTRMMIAGDGGIYFYAIKSGATQAAAGAAADELWSTSGHVSLPDNVLMLGV